MKNKLSTFILFLLMVLLIGAIVIFGIFIYLDVTKTDTSDLIYTIKSKATDIEPTNIIQNTITTGSTNTSSMPTVNEVETVSTLSTGINGNFFGSQLTETQKKIYDGLQENKIQMRDGKAKIQYGGVFSDILEKENGSEELGKEYQAAVEAFLYDNPDVFYIDANKLYLNVETTSKILRKTYNVYIGPAENATYYVNGFKSKEQVEEAIKKIEQIKNTFVKHKTGNVYKNIMMVHDYLVENTEYDQEYSSIGTYSIYGALVDKRCVCEGYAKSLKYILNAMDIPCEIVQGTATTSKGKTESHAWNAVNLNGKWYYIDNTWDDPIIIGTGTISKSVQYKYFLKGSKTMNKDHVLLYKFSDEGRTFSYPPVEIEDYR